MMRTKYALVALVPIGLALQLGLAGAAPSGELGVRWEGTVDSQASRIVIRNLNARPARALLGDRTITLSAEGIVEIPAVELGAGPLRLRSDAHLLVLQAPDELDVTSLEVEKGAVDLPRRAGGRLQALQLSPEGAPGPEAHIASVRHGATGAVEVRAVDAGAQVQVAVELLAPHSSVRIRQLDSFGNEMTSLVASASIPVRWRASLGPVSGESRIELQTLQGEAQGTAAAVVDGAGSAERSPIVPLTKAGGGLAKFVPTINWQGSGNMIYKVESGPASVCGDLHISRNFGLYVVTPGWICTDASGNATRGPWSYASQPGDEDATAYIVWSNGLSTNSARHIWDKTKPVVTGSTNNALPAPTSASGTADDGSYGSGFSAGFSSTAGGGKSECRIEFRNTGTGLYWCGGSDYNQFWPCNVACTISGMPSRFVTWSAPTLPPGSAHHTDECYQWKVSVYDNSTYGQKSEKILKTFCVN